MGQVMSLDQVKAYCQQAKADGRTVVFTNGLFDLLHAGHLDYLERARTMGDVLVVGLNSDRSARALKGERHPIMAQAERARLLAALTAVDAVVIFDEVVATSLIEFLRPDVYVKGGDYAHKDWPEREAALALDCQVALISFLKGHSTSELIATILARFGDDGPAS